MVEDDDRKIVDMIMGCRSFLTIICRKPSAFQVGKGTEDDTQKRSNDDMP